MDELKDSLVHDNLMSPQIAEDYHEIADEYSILYSGKGESILDWGLWKKDCELLMSNISRKYYKELIES